MWATQNFILHPPFEYSHPQAAYRMDWDLTHWNWIAIAQIFLSAGLGTAAINGLFGGYREYKERKRKAEHLAICIAVILEEFADQCAGVLARQDIYKMSPGALMPPNLPAYPDDPAAWQSLHKSLAEQSMNFRREVAVRQSISKDVIGAGYLDDVRTDDFIVSHAGAAINLAEELRLAYGFPVRRSRGISLLASRATEALERDRQENK